MESRKIQMVGNRSYSISLPKRWVLENNLGAQDIVFVHANDSDELVISRSGANKKESKEITVDLEDLADVSEFLVFCYVKNVNKLKIYYKRSYPIKISGLKNALKYLDGYDITVEDDSKMEISFLFNDLNITLPKLLVRMVYLIKLALLFNTSSSISDIEDNEMNIDRLYNLSKRIIFSAVRDPKIRDDNGINFDEDLFFYKDVFKRLEQIGDSIYRLGTSKLADPDLQTAHKFVDLLEEALVKKNKLHQFKEKISSIRIAARSPGSQDLLGKMQERCFDIFENMRSIEFNKQYFQ